MDPSWLAITFSDIAWIAIAFFMGLLARLVGLPPLVGFLAAGFALNAFGAAGGDALNEIADLGVTLLLFSIGLKLRLRGLLRPEVWGVASVHMLITVLVFGAAIYGLSVAGLALFGALDVKLALMIAFALSFSSTVFAVKVLEEKGEMASLHGRVSIGILIIQDLIAVLFLTVSTGKIPSPWALALIGLLPLRPLLYRLMDRTGHGELLILYGLLLALGGAAVFELVGMKADLGALVLGVLVAGHPKASELAKSLLGFKDLFLVGFFLSIGLSGVPTFEAIGIAVLLAALVPLKVALFFLLLARFRLRARSSLLTSLSLANYSEFGLIVGAIGVANGWITGDWLTIIAIALSITFVLASPLNAAAHVICARSLERLRPFETRTRLPNDQPVDTGDAEILIFGMGRVGSGAYDVMRERYGRRAIGVDFDSATVGAQQVVGRDVIFGDATDSDFWEKLRPGKIDLVMLALPHHKENMDVAKQLVDGGYAGQIAAIARFADEISELEGQGVHAAFNIYTEAGAGFAEHVCKQFEQQSAG